MLKLGSLFFLLCGFAVADHQPEFPIQVPMFDISELL
jgi:hypothetical protein